MTPQRATTRLVAAALLSALLWGIALLRFPLAIIYGCGLQNLDRLAQPGVATGLVLTNYTCSVAPLETLDTPLAGIGIVMALAILGLFAAYGLALHTLRHTSATARLGLLIGGVAIVFVALLLPIYPVSSIDIYDYAFRGRMAAFYQVNNFVTTPAPYTDDPLYWYTAWRRSVTAYGPLWEAMSWLTARLAGQHPTVDLPLLDALLRLLIAYKLLAALGFLLCGLVLWWVLGQLLPEWRAFGTALWLWNPLALWETVGAGHNDAWMALWIVIAIWAFLRGQQLVATHQQTKLFWPLLAFVALTLGGLIKYSALVFGPSLLLAALRQLPTWRQRLALIASGALICGGLVLLAYTPFWVGITTLRNFTDRGELVYASWLAALQPALEPWLGKGTSQITANLIGLGLLALGVLWSIWRGWKNPTDPAGNSLWLLLWFLFIANPWFQPWYLLWALALTALQPWRANVVASMVIFCATALLSYVSGSFLRPALGWPPDSLYWNVLISTLIYLPPLIILAHRRPWRNWWQPTKQYSQNQRNPDLA